MNSSLAVSLNQLTGVSDFIDYIVWFSAEILIVIIIALITLYLLRDKKPFRGQKYLFVILFAALFSWASSEVLNYIFPSARPFLVLEEIQPLFTVGGYDAYPSGHTSFIFGFAVMLVFFKRTAGLVVLFFAFIIGIARIASGVHWPIDIIGGILLGTSSAFVTYYYVKQIESSNILKRIQFWK